MSKIRGIRIALKEGQVRLLSGRKKKEAVSQGAGGRKCKTKSNYPLTADCCQINLSRTMGVGVKDKTQTHAHSGFHLQVALLGTGTC